MVSMRSMTMSVMCSATLLAGAAGQAGAQIRAFGLGSTGARLVSFDPASPGTLLSDTPISGLQSGDSLVQIDFRPATGQLYAISGQNRVYRFSNLAGGQVEQVGAGGAFTITGKAGMDFNPAPDRIRLTSSDDQNLRVNPDTGALAGNDSATFGNLRFEAGDSNAGNNPNIVSIAYNNNRFGPGRPATATMFGVHRVSNFVTQLVRVGSENGSPISPNEGRVFTVGSIFGIFSNENFGFDSVFFNGADRTFLSGTTAIGTTAFYTLSLSDGSNSFMGTVGDGSFTLRDIAVVPAPGAATLLAATAVMAARRRRA